MMSDRSRSLLDAAREGLAPDAATAARVRAKIAAATGAAAATGSVAAIVTPKTSIAATLIKIGGALLAVGAVTTALVVTRPEPVSPSAPQLEVAPAEPADDIRADIRVVAPSESTPVPAAVRSENAHAASRAQHRVEAIDDGSRAPAVLGARAGEAAIEGPKRARTVATEDEPFDTISLAREVELIDLAMVSLRKKVPHAALVAIKAYHRETGGRGQMAEDAAAIEIEARCLQDQDVTTLLERFDDKWPESAQRARIQTTCFARK